MKTQTQRGEGDGGRECGCTATSQEVPGSPEPGRVKSLLHLALQGEQGPANTFSSLRLSDRERMNTCYWESHRSWCLVSAVLGNKRSPQGGGQLGHLPLDPTAQPRVEWCSMLASVLLLLDCKSHEARDYIWFISVTPGESVLPRWALNFLLNEDIKSLNFYVLHNSAFYCQIKSWVGNGSSHTQEILFSSVYIISLVLSPDSGELHIYDYSQNIEKNRTVHSWAARICEDRQCSHSPQLGHHWSVSKPGEKCPGLVYVSKPVASWVLPLPPSAISQQERQQTALLLPWLLAVLVAQEAQSSLLLTSNNSKRNKRGSPRMKSHSVNIFILQRPEATALPLP